MFLNVSHFNALFYLIRACLVEKREPIVNRKKATDSQVSQSVRKGVYICIKMTEHSRIDSIIKLFYNFSLQSSLYKSA